MANGTAVAEKPKETRVIDVNTALTMPGYDVAIYIMQDSNTNSEDFVR